MANDKDFLLKNAVEVGGPTKVTLGSVTDNVQQTSYDIASASYDNKSFNFSSQDSSPVDVAFKTDGTKLYVMGNSTDTIYQYALSTAWDVSTASYESKSLSVNTQETDAYSVVFNNDGTKVYTVGRDFDAVQEYNLSTAWDISTGSHSQSFSVSSQATDPRKVRFKSDGTKMYVFDASTDNVFQYSLSTAFDVSTSSYESKSFNFNTQDASPLGIGFNAEGTKMFSVGATNDSVYQYSLSTSWDVSTSSYDSVAFSVATQESAPSCVVFDTNGSKMFVVGGGSDTVHQYSTASYADQIDLATGNYFADTLAANTTYTLSNAGGVQSFQLEVTGGAVGYDLGAAVYDSVSFSVSGQETLPYGLTFKPDGTKMYVVGGSGDDINQYTLSTAFDLSSASFDSVTFSVASQDSAPRKVKFNDDGTKMFIVGTSTDTVYQYSLSTAYDISTASYDSVSFSVSSQDTDPRGLDFKPDGTKMYILGTSSDDVFQYSLSTAWDLSTASYDSVSFDTTAQDNDPFSITFNNDGTLFFIVTNANDSVYQYSCSTAYDISTASYDSVSFSLASQETNAYDAAFSSNGVKMFIIGASTDAVYQYTTGADTTITWPSSIEWAGGVAPSAPATR